MHSSPDIAPNYILSCKYSPTLRNKLAFNTRVKRHSLRRRSISSTRGVKGCDCAVINARFTKPIDADTTAFFASAADVVVTLEDHVLPGGYGSSLLELFNERSLPTPVVCIGWPDQFIEHATTVDELRQKYGLTVLNTVARVKSALAEAPSSQLRGLAVA